MVLYLAISQDKYELPIALSDTAVGLARMLGSYPSTISSHITLYNQGKIKKQKYIKVEVDDD